MKVYSYLDSGRPVLATRLPTHTQVLTDEISCLVDPEPEAMARGLVSLLRDAGRREQLAASAKEYAQRELTRDAFERKLLRFYDLIGERIHENWSDGQHPLEAGHPSPR
jgi:glycosyltransferase involved in cell wall biosynthesis